MPRKGIEAISSADVRASLVRALKLDLVGPGRNGEFADEQLPRVRPSTWYLTGFLIPSDAPAEQAGDKDEDDDIGELPVSAGLAEENAEEQKSAKKGFFPSSMGLSFLASREATSLEVTIRWGDYARVEILDEEEKPMVIWQRHPHEETLEIAFQNKPGEPLVLKIPNTRGLELQAVQRVISEKLGDGIPAGTRSVSLFLVNRRGPNEEKPDETFAFQPELEVRCDQPFVARPDLRGTAAQAWDEQVADLHYADVPEYATGHGVSAEWDVINDTCHVLRTTWIPAADVERTETRDIDGVELAMDALGALADGAAARTALGPLVIKYQKWMDEQHAGLMCLSQDRRETAEELLRLASLAAGRIERGIDVLADDADALDAFRVANRSVASALRKRLGAESPRWRAFQLAFILLNLPGLVDPKDPHRDTVDLLFFPTGGGKTEAYLGLAAFTMILRRLKHRDSQGAATLGGAGVSVIMRYTLRLLTLDQLSRAAGLVCALELERDKDPRRYGAWPFEIGLWVGKAATPNLLGKKGDNRQDVARTKVRRFKNDPTSQPSPIPLENCPWCGRRFTRLSFALLPNEDHPRELRIVCANLECEFKGDRALPIVAIDEQLYRRLPAFLIATVDKFASLPWIGQSGALLGGADHFDAGGFYGPADPGRGKRMDTPLPPPDFVIQDELHLIAGPLGTMAGLYEAAIEGLCVRELAGRPVRPKIVASTATARQAHDQIQALFGRSTTMVFPPLGPDRCDSFFAQVLSIENANGRKYVGVAAQGRSPKVMLRKTWLALMGAAERAYRDAGGEKNDHNPADPYMTILGYFNSLRELGGCRRILEEEVQITTKGYGRGRLRVGETPGLFQDRRGFSEVVELTSRVPTNKVAEARRRLERPFSDKEQRVDCAIATNMISVGLDIQRLGLMVVLGQPKTHSEYIQATSRVGRDDQRPGLVVTLLNIHKPRDRSHYERFSHYHETFYRSVEIASVTPFSARALDRGFAGAMVSLARHSQPQLTPPSGAEKLGTVRAAIEKRLLDDFLERVRQQPILDEDELKQRLQSVRSRVVDLLDSWQKIFDDYHAVGVSLQYQEYEQKNPKPLLRDMLDRTFESEHHRKFKVNRSLRDVEPNVNIFLKELSGVFVEEPA
jgi:hypothetical protein